MRERDEVFEGPKPLPLLIIIILGIFRALLSRLIFPFNRLQDVLFVDVSPS